MTLSFEDLFALRIAAQDRYTDESNIIRNLKLNLIEGGMNENEIDDYLVNFYKNYGIEIDKEVISEVRLIRRPRIVLNNNFMNLLMNRPIRINVSPIVNNNLPNNHENNNPNNESNNLPNSLESNNPNNESDEESVETDDDMPELIDFDDSNTLNVSPNVSSNVSFNLFENEFGTNALSFLNNFNQIMNLNLNQNQNMEDVRITLEEESIKEIENYVLDKDKDDKCIICMMSFKKDDKVSKVKCKHEFHKDCVETWLKNYNYKCPVCREECGKPKYNL